MGVVSILHRISAVIIWVAMAFFLPVLYISLESPEGFEKIKLMLKESFIAQFFLWGFLTAFGYYIIASLKHLMQDLGHFETLEGGRIISQLTIALAVLLSIVIGYGVWG